MIVESLCLLFNKPKYNGRSGETGKKIGPMSLSELEKVLKELKEKNYRVLECIIFTKYNQNCSLEEAAKIVLNSTTWVNEKEYFIKRHNEETIDFLDSTYDNIKKIEHTITENPEENRIVFHIKKKRTV